MYPTKDRRNRAKPRWLHLFVLLAALTSISGQAFESGHVHFDAQPADCWVCHSGAAAVTSDTPETAVSTVSASPDLALLIEAEQDRKAYLPPATGPPLAF
jgi:hypothetical protein